MKRLLSIVLCAVLAATCVAFSADAKTVKPAKVRGLRVARLSKTTLKIAWKKASKAKRYLVYMKANNKGFKKLTDTKKRTYTKKGLKVGNWYCFKIRAYKKVSGKKVYGKYSAVKRYKMRSYDYLVNAIEPYGGESYTYYSGADSFKMGGNKYYRGFTMNRGWEDKHNLLFNLNGKYKKMSFCLGAVDGDENADESTLMIYGDNDLIRTLKRKKDDLPKKYNVDVSGVYKLELIRSEYITYGFGDVKLFY